MRQTIVVAAIAAALVSGCDRGRPTLPSLPAAFATLPMPPQPEFLGQAGSEDALMFTFRSTVRADSVTAYYRDLFARDTAFHVLSSTQGGIGEHAFYVEFKDRPLWVRIRPEAANEGSIVELTGAVVTPRDTVRDTTARGPAHR